MKNEIAACFALRKAREFPEFTHAMLCTVFEGEALQNNEARTSEQVNSSGFENKKDKKEKDEGNGDFQAIAEEEPEEILDNASKNTPQGSNQEGMDPQNITKHTGAKS